MSDGHQSELLRQRRFLPFFVTQFLGAFNDNLYKNALVILLAFHGASLTAMSSHTLVNLAGALFILPFFLFSATSGQLADKYEKSQLIRVVKVFEIGVMLVASAGFYLNSAAVLLGGLFLMGLHSTLFGPVKYAILPQHLKPEELVGGNGLVEMGTFVAILLGTILGGFLIAISGLGVLLASATMVAVAVLGYLASRHIPLAPAAAPELRINWNPITETWRSIQFTRQNRTVLLSVLGVSWFWFYGATFLAQFPNYAKDVLGGNEQVVTLLLTLFSIGVAAGSLLCERLSGAKVEIGLVPFGSIGLSVFAFDLFFANRALPAGVSYSVAQFVRDPLHWRVMADLVLIGMFGGFYIVPLYALIQTRSEVSHRSRIIAGNNILNALFMVASAVMAIVLLGAGMSIPQLFLLMAVLNAAVAVYIYTLVPEFLMRFLIWLLIHSAYRLEKRGIDNIPADGPAVLVCNHVSFVDALVIAAACPRPVRFVMDHRIFRIPILSFIFRTGRAIPIASLKEDPSLLERAYDEIAAALEAGDVVAIFPEGKLTADGEMSAFRPGIERIVQRTPVPVVPLALQGLWGSFFSRMGGRAMRRLPRGVFSKIALVASTPVQAPAVKADGLQATVASLRGGWR
jgi:1-acyl-sn-glycerol-3-phosphate acyltransferase